MLPEMPGGAIRSVKYVSYPSHDHRLKGDRIAGFVDDEEALQQAIFVIMSVERYSSKIHGDNFGVELLQYRNQGIEYLRAGIRNTLRDALTQDDRILDVSIESITPVGTSAALVVFIAHTKYGTMQQSLEVIT